jgi:hypothetical protein
VKKKVKKSSKPKKEVTQPFEDVITESKNAFNFGGLPQRDLKKNLGCG